jgi:PAS domain S-box
MRWFSSALPPADIRSSRFVLLVVAGAVSAAVLQRYALHPWAGDRIPYVCLFPSVLVASWLCGATAGIVVSAVGLPLCAWLFVVPPLSPALRGMDLLAALVAFVHCLIVSLLCGIIRKAVANWRSTRGQAVRDFENMADHAPGFVWSTDGAENTGFVNQAWRTFTGVSPNRREIDRLQLVHPGDIARVRALIADARAAGVPYQVEYRLRRADGTYRWILEHAVPRLGHDGRFEGFTGSGTDVTSSHQERDELRFIGDLHRDLAASLDLHKTAETLTRAVVPSLADWCAIHLLDEQDGVLRPVQIHHVDPEKVLHANEITRREGADERLSPCFARILNEGEARVVEHVDDAFLAELATDEEHLGYLRALGLVSFVGVPLRVAGRVIGLLSFASAESCRVFGTESVQLALKIGGIAAFALENARLHRGVRDALAAEERARRDREHSDRQFRSAWEADIFGICLVDRAGHVRAGNDTFLRLAGHTREDLAAGRVGLRSRLGDRRNRFGTFLWENANESRRCEPFEKICIRSDGTEVPVLVGGSINPDGATATVFMLDLTARKAAESELSRQRGLLKTIIDAIPAMVAYIGVDERFVLHNLQYEKWLGLGPGEIAGKTLRELVGEESYARVQPHVQAALAGHSSGHESIIRGSGRHRDLMVSYRPDRDAAGRVLGVVMHAYDITESRRMAAELARSERRHRTLITNSAAIVWTADARGVLQSVDGWEHFTGVATEPGTCPMWFRLIHPADRAHVMSHWLRPDGECHTWEAYYRMLAADGRYHHVHARAAAIVGPDGRVEEWIGTVTDITQRVEAEQSLRRKEAELKLIVDTMPALVAYIDRDLRYGLVNLAYEKWFGLAPEKVRGRLVREILGEKAFARLACRFTRVMTGEEVAFEELAEYSHGGTRWINALYTPHRDENGEVVGCFALVLDITARKQAEQQMAELAERYRFLADAMPQSVWTADAEGRRDYVNRRWCEYTGIRAEDALAGRWEEFIHPDDREETRRRWEHALASGESYQAEHRLRDASGNYHWFLSLAIARRDQEGRVLQWVGTATNIDALRHAYLELAEARAELRRHADRLESEVRARTARLREVNEELEAFTYSASHDLRVPLHHIHGFAQAILEDREAGLSPSGHANMRLIINAAERMDTLIMDLLAYSRLSRAEIVIEPTAVEPILNDVFAQHRGTIQAKHAIIHVERPLPDVPADRVGLQQILFNLVGNALKFVPAGRQPEIRIRVEQRGARLRLWVEDNGIGIEKRHHEGVFRLFQRLHGSRDYSGTGIGLSLVKRAAERMGGVCGVESEPGRGSRFWVEFQDAPDGTSPDSPPDDAARSLGLTEHAA